MRSKFLLLIFLLVGINFTLKAESFLIIENDSAFYFADENTAEADRFEEQGIQIAQTDRLAHFQNSKLGLKYKAAFQENKRLTAAMLTFALGMLGVHRLYLGTIDQFLPLQNPAEQQANNHQYDGDFDEGEARLLAFHAFHFILRFF